MRVGKAEFDLTCPTNQPLWSVITEFTADGITSMQIGFGVSGSPINFQLFATAPVPEPSGSVLLMLAGTVGLLRRQRR